MTPEEILEAITYREEARYTELGFRRVLSPEKLATFLAEHITK